MVLSHCFDATDRLKNVRNEIYFPGLHKSVKTWGPVKANLPLITFVLCFISKKIKVYFQISLLYFVNIFVFYPCCLRKTQGLVILNNKLYQHVCFFQILILCMSCFVEEAFSLICRSSKNLKNNFLKSLYISPAVQVHLNNLPNINYLIRLWI